MRKSSITSLAASIGLVSAVPVSDEAAPQPATLQPRGVWQPAVGSSWQIVLSQTLKLDETNPSVTPDVNIFDIDMFTHRGASTIASLHKLNKKVICYFSAGSYEPNRPDSASLPPSVRGFGLEGWPGEYWLDVRNPAVRSVMASRIKIASQMGCDAIDPDNVDGYQNKNGLSLTAQDSIDYLKFLATEAAKYGMSTGLKNALDIIPSVLPFVQFAINEQCAQYGECSEVQPFIAAGKPVFHIEYVDASTSFSKRSLQPREPAPGQAWWSKTTTRLGCYVDFDDDNVFQDDSDDDDDMTPQMCQQYCSDYAFFGVEAGDSCYCSDTMTASNKRPDAECSKHCTGDDAQTCGGRRRIEIYRIGNSPAPSSSPTITTTSSRKAAPATTKTTTVATPTKTSTTISASSSSTKSSRAASSSPTTFRPKTTSPTTVKTATLTTTTTKSRTSVRKVFATLNPQPSGTAKASQASYQGSSGGASSSSNSGPSCSSMKNIGGFSTVIKTLALGGWVRFCNGVVATTLTN